MERKPRPPPASYMRASASGASKDGRTPRLEESAEQKCAVDQDAEQKRLAEEEAERKPRPPPASYMRGSASYVSKDGRTLYLFLTQKAIHPLVIKGLKNQINRIRIVGEGTKLSHEVVGKMYWSDVPGLLYIDVPEEKQDAQVTVIALQLKGKVDLYREDGQVIESN